MDPASEDDILDFWFSDRISANWFKQSDALDAEIAERFTTTYEAARMGDLDRWRDRPRGALALTIVLDQFPRNLFRGSPRAFQTDGLARASANHALAAGHDQDVTSRERTFFYLPLMHSEDLADQRRCVDLYRALGNQTSLDYAIQHRDIVERFGRFPHRNAVLGRETTPEETEFLKTHSGF